jgi:hypothetical protein
MYICEDSEVLIDKDSNIDIKHFTLYVFECRWLSNMGENTLKSLLKYCVEVADLCGIQNDKINFGLLPYMTWNVCQNWIWSNE